MALPPALAGSMSPVADPAVDGRAGDGLHDLLLLEKVVVLLVIRIELVVPGEALYGVLVGELALVRVLALLRSCNVMQIARVHVPAATLQVALALEVLSADFALSRLSRLRLLNLSGLATLLLVRRGLERGLGWLTRNLSEPKRLVARVAAPSTVAFATIATSNRTGKVALQVVLVLGGAGQAAISANTERRDSTVSSWSSRAFSMAEIKLNLSAGVPRSPDQCFLMAQIRNQTSTCKLRYLSSSKSSSSTIAAQSLNKV